MSTVQGKVPTSEVLTKSADILRDSKWTTIGGWAGDFENRTNGSLCLEGGIMAALGIRFEEGENDNAVLLELQRCPAYKAVQEYLVERGDFEDTETSLWIYNDTYAKNKADVIRVLRTVARREKKKELASE